MGFGIRGGFGSIAVCVEEMFCFWYFFLEGRVFIFSLGEFRFLGFVGFIFFGRRLVVGVGCGEG